MRSITIIKCKTFFTVFFFNEGDELPLCILYRLNSIFAALTVESLYRNLLKKKIN